jgi:PAS domain S-box-containing protein
LEGKSTKEEFRIHTPKGGIKWIQNRSYPVKDPVTGEVLKVIGVAEDITERRMIGDKLVHSEERFRSFMEFLPGVAYIKDEDQRLVYTNSMFANFLGKKPDNLIGKKTDQMMPPEMARSFKRENEEVLSSNKPKVFEHTYPGPDGPTYWLTFKFPIGIQGERRLLGTISMNVTERKELELELEASEKRYQSMLENSNLLISIYDRDGKCLLMNQIVASLFGGKPEDFIGKTFGELHPGMAEEYTKRVRDVINRETVRVFDDLVDFGDAEKWLLTTVHPVYDREGNTTGAQVISQDITDRKNTELELKQSRKKLMEESINSRLYLDLLTHDIGNIHQSMNGYLGLFKSSSFSSVKGEILDSMEDLMKRSVSLTRKVKLLSKARSSPGVLEPMDVVQVLKNAGETAIGIDGNHNLEFNLYKTGNSVNVLGDPLMEEMFFNLFHNSIKHNDKDHHVIDVDVTLNEDYGTVDISIEDNGPGLPKEIKRFIERPLEERVTDTRRGLGLLLVRTLVEKYGGNLAYGEQGSKDGTRIIVSLPYAGLISGSRDQQ